VVARTPSRVRQGAGIATVTGFVVGLTITSASA
jgi:predicted RNA-binding protein with TRAM domain